MNKLLSKRSAICFLFAAIFSVQFYDERHEQDFFVTKIPGATYEYVSLQSVAERYGKPLGGSDLLGYVKIRASEAEIKKLGEMPGFKVEPITYYGIPKQPRSIGLLACAPTPAPADPGPVCPGPVQPPPGQPCPKPPGPIPPGPPPVVGNQKIDWGVARVHAPEAQKIQDAHTIKVCVVDTGVDLSHPDLKILRYRNFTPGNPNDVHDAVGHGTHTSGLVGALNNALGMLGASQAELFMAKVLDDTGQGQMDWIANGVVWCVQQGADIISESLGGRGFSQILYNAHVYASQNGVVIFAAAGNDGSPQVGCPACFQIPGLYSIAALDRNDQKAYFSNYGKIDFACPGVDIVSTMPMNKGSYGPMSGTSMATPICAGVAAIFKAQRKPFAATSLGNPSYFGAGLLDAAKAVQ